MSDSRRHINAPIVLRRALKRRALKDLTVAQRKLELTEDGSKRHNKALARVQRLHGRVGARGRPGSSTSRSP